MTKMFTYNGQKLITWNPFTGCKFDCTYCWAKSLACNKLKALYPNGFVPDIHPKRFNKHFKPDEFIFVSSMGDISFCPHVERDMIIDNIKKHPNTKFLFCTKNPGTYYHFPDLYNAYYGATIETNRPTPKQFSKAPEPYMRYAVMASIENVKKFISIEPIMDFDLFEFVTWLSEIKPTIVEIGADNYNNHLPEPSSNKVSSLIYAMEKMGIEVVQKQGLERLLNNKEVI